MPSLSSLALFIFLILIVPVSVFKIGYDRKFPLIKHKFSLPLEIKNFYLPIVIIQTILIVIFLHFCSFNVQLIDVIVFGKDIKSNYTPSVKEIFNCENIVYFCVTYILSFFGGWLWAYINLEKIKSHIEEKGTLFGLKDITMFGMWRAIVHSQKDNVVFNLDVLTDGDLLYSGELYHYDFNEEGLVSVTLKNTKRFLVSISEVMGNNEKKYPIPGKFTYFAPGKVKNINLQSIVAQNEDLVFWGEKVKGSLEQNEKIIAKLQEVVNDIQSSQKKQTSAKSAQPKSNPKAVPQQAAAPAPKKKKNNQKKQ